MLNSSALCPHVVIFRILEVNDSDVPGVGFPQFPFAKGEFNEAEEKHFRAPMLSRNPSRQLRAEGGEEM